MSLSPRADYVCFRCEEREPGTGGPFLNLPITKPKCPVCGKSRWMQRQWSGYSIAIASRSAPENSRMSHEEIKRVDQLTRPILEQHQAQRAPHNQFAARAVSMGNVQKEVASLAGPGAGVFALPSGTAKPNGPAPVGSAVAPRHTRTQIAGTWSPSAADVQKAAGA